MASITNRQAYIGSELDIFAHALRWKAYFSHLLVPYIGRRVLEVGAGIGATTAVLCDGTQERWVCLEPDADLLAKMEIKIRAQELPACCMPQLGFITSLEKDVFFDTIIYIDVLEHIANDRQELEQASQKLISGGKIIVLSPAYPFLYSPFDQSIGHYRRYTRKSLSTLTPPGCEIVRVIHLDSVGLLTSLANRIILRQSLPTQEQILFWDRRLVPLSKFFDRLLRYRLGRSIICVWGKCQLD